MKEYVENGRCKELLRFKHLPFVSFLCISLEAMLYRIFFKTQRLSKRITMCIIKEDKKISCKGVRI